jgi:hypothetical protein
MLISGPRFQSKITALIDLENIATSAGSGELGPFNTNDLIQR